MSAARPVFACTCGVAWGTAEGPCVCEVPEHMKATGTLGLRFGDDDLHPEFVESDYDLIAVPEPTVGLKREAAERVEGRVVDDPLVISNPHASGSSPRRRDLPSDRKLPGQTVGDCLDVRNVTGRITAVRVANLTRELSTDSHDEQGIDYRDDGAGSFALGRNARGALKAPDHMNRSE